MTKTRTIGRAFCAASILTALGALMCISTARANNHTATNLIASGRTISGTVMDACGAIAANQPVKLTKKRPPQSGPTDRKPGQDSTGQEAIGTPEHRLLQKASGLDEEVVRPAVKTDSSGRFTFKDVPAGKYTIVAGLGKTQVRQEIEVTESADPAPVQIKLEK